MPSPSRRPVLALVSVSDGVIPRRDLAVAATSALSRPVSRRSLLVALGATAVLAAVARPRPRPDRASIVDATAWQPPPDYRGIVGVL